MIETIPILAMFFAAVANILMSIGAVIQKVGADQAPEIGKHPIKDIILGFVKNKTWIIGAILVLSGFPLLLVAFNFGGLIYTQPMVSIGVLSIVFYSIKVLKEKISLTEIIGIILIIIGPIFIAFGFWNVTDEISNVNLNVVLIFYLIIYFVISVLILLAKRIRCKGKKRAVVYAFITGIFISTGAFSGRVSALFTGFTSSLFIFLLLINIGIAALFAQIMYQQGRAVITLTISNFFNITLPALAGVLVLNEKLNLSLFFGFVIIILGCILVSKIQSKVVN